MHPWFLTIKKQIYIQEKIIKHMEMLSFKRGKKLLLSIQQEDSVFTCNAGKKFLKITVSDEYSYVAGNI